jgi:hypothetical protein
LLGDVESADPRAEFDGLSVHDNALTSIETKSQSESQRAGIEIITVGHFPMKGRRRSLTLERLSLGVDGWWVFAHIARHDRV